MRIDELKQLLSEIDRNIESLWNRILTIHSKLVKLMDANGFPEFSEEDISRLLAEDQAEDVQALAAKLHNSAEVIGKSKEYQTLEQKRRANYNHLSSIILLKGFLIHISMIDEEGKAQKRAYTRYDLKDVPEKAFDNAPKYTELYQASKLSEREYTFISNICEKTIKEKALQYYKPALINLMADFIRTFLPDAMPIRREPEFDATSLLAMPSSPGINNIMQILTSKNTNELKKGAKKARSNTKIKTGTRNNADNTPIKHYDFDTDNSNVTIEWKSIVEGTNKGVRKMLIFSMIEVMKQAYHQEKNGQGCLSAETISFPLSKLVENGMYSNLQNARRGFTAALDVLMNISFTATMKKSTKRNNITNNQSSEDYITRAFFIGHGIKNSQCSIELNKKAKWDMLLRYYTYILPFAFQLNSNAFNLLYSICFLARQNCSDIHKTNKFKISMRTIKYKLGLPDEEETKNPNTSIIEPIENAISEIEEHLAKTNTETDYIKITPILPEKCTYKTYLDNGCLEISIAGKYAEKFTSIAANQDKAIASKARIKEKAQRDALKELYKEQLKKDEQEDKAEANQ